MGESENARGIDAGALYRLLKGDICGTYKVCHTVKKAGNGACDGSAFCEGTQPSLLFYTLPSELIEPVRHARCTEAVADKDDPVAGKLSEGGAHRCRVEMYAVAYKLRGHSITVKDGVYCPGISVGEWGHGVIEVYGVAGAGLYGTHGGIVIRIGMGKGDHDLILKPADVAFKIRAFLRGKPKDLNKPSGGFNEAARRFYLCFQYKGFVLGSFFCGADEGSFHIKAHQLCDSVVTRVFIGEAFSPRQYLTEGICGEGHGGGADRGNAPAKLKGGDLFKGFLCGITHIIAQSSVKMQVYKPGDHIGVLCVQIAVPAGGGVLIRKHFADHGSRDLKTASVKAAVSPVY